jgi:hypothetical protein
VILVTTTVLSAVAVRRTAVGSPSLTPVRMAGSSLFFDDPDVQQELARQGFRLVETSLGSRQTADEPSLGSSYDIALAGSDDAGRHTEKVLTDKGFPAHHTSPPFSSPMVIITYQSIVDSLQKLGLVQLDKGTWIFDMHAYLQKVGVGIRWRDIPGNTIFQSPNRVLLSTTDPFYSNSGGMFVAIASYVLNNNDPVDNVAAFTPNLPLIRSCFTEQGVMQTHTPDLLRLFLTDGMSRFPMGLFYEKDFLDEKLKRGNEVSSQIVLMYPNPTVISDNTFVWWTDSGRKVDNLLHNDPVLVELEERSGYRTSNDNERFVHDMAAKGIRVPELAKLAVAPLPTDENFQALVEKVHN